MLRPRVIPTLLLRGESLVKTVRFGPFQYIGDPINTVRIFNELEVDELAFLDITATVEGRSPNVRLLADIANECFMPLAYGGGIRTFDHAAQVLLAGFEKVVINSHIQEDPQLITRLADHFGSQAIIASIDVRRRTDGRYTVRTRSGTLDTGREPVAWARRVEALGAGEILLTSIDREGTWQGYDMDVVRVVAESVRIPLIASGGAGSLDDVGAVVRNGGASAAAVGSLVVYQKRGMGVLVNFPAPSAIASVMAGQDDGRDDGDGNTSKTTVLTSMDGATSNNPSPGTPFRTFVGLSDVAGHFSTVAAALRSIGVDARLHNLSPNPLAHGGSPSRTGRLLQLRYAPIGSRRLRVWTWLLRVNRIVRRMRAAALFPWAAVRYDAFVLGGHETFLGGIDLWILRRLGKRVVVVFTGSDHRPPYLSGIGIRDFANSSEMAAQARRTRGRVRSAERGATAIVALPASAQFHRQPFVDFTAVGIPFVPPHGLEAVESHIGDLPNRPIRILHSPTEPGPKGTAEVRNAVSACRTEGLQLDYRELIGRPNAEVLEALTWCDFIVDEVYSDTPMAKFATEAAYFGKPAIVGSYATALYERSDGSVPPVHMCHPEELQDGVRKLATDTAYRRDLGRRARDFVLHAWSPESVATRLLRVINGDVPSDWLVQPSSVRYIHGWGVPEAVLRDVLSNLIETEGIEVLQLAPGAPSTSEIVRFVGMPTGTGVGP